MSKNWKEIKHERRRDPNSSAAIEQGRAAAREAFLLGERIRETRERLGLTQKELADKVGTSQSAVARAEAGGVTPSLDSLHRYAAAMGMQLTIDFEPIAAGSV